MDYGNVYNSLGNPFILTTKIDDYFNAPAGCRDVSCLYWRSADGLAYVMTAEQTACWRFNDCD